MAKKEEQYVVNVRGTLFRLKLNSKVTFPVNRASSIRTTCSLLSLQTGKRFKTHTSREDMTITVTRIK